MSRDLAARDRARTFLLTGIGMSLASLVNPRGWGLHLSAIDLLGLTSTGRMREFMSPDFNLGIPVLYVFEAALLSLLVLLGRKRRRLSWAECTLLAVFLFQTLHAIRHAFLFILVAMPILARELSGLLEGVENRFTRRSARALAEQGRLKSDRVWIPALCVLFLVLSQTAPGLFRHDLYGTHLSRNAAAYIRDNPDRFERIFNTEDHCCPKRDRLSSVTR